MATSTPYGSNTFIPNLEATNSLVVDFSRNPDEFALPNYTQYVPVEKTEGKYVRMDVEAAARLLNTDAREHEWPDGADAPTGEGQLDPHSFYSYICRRYAPAFRMGELAADQAAWDRLAQAAAHVAQQLMTIRTQLVITKLTNTANWATGHYSAVSSISGVTGKWDVSTTARKDIKRSLDYAAEKIRKATLGKVKPKDLRVVMSAGCARKISVTQEIQDHIKGSPAAEKSLTTQLGGVNEYGLPSTLYGYPIVIEDTVKVTNAKGATKATSYVLPDTTPIMVSQIGGLEGVEGSPSFSTVQLFLYEEMSVESKHDRDNRRYLGRAVDNVGVEIVAPISGFLFTSAVD